MRSFCHLATSVVNDLHQNVAQALFAVHRRWE
jgi:hypothetical protein